MISSSIPVFNFHSYNMYRKVINGKLISINRLTLSRICFEISTRSLDWFVSKMLAAGEKHYRGNCEVDEKIQWKGVSSESVEGFASDMNSTIDLAHNGGVKVVIGFRNGNLSEEETSIHSIDMKVKKTLTYKNRKLAP